VRGRFLLAVLVTREDRMNDTNQSTIDIFTPYTLGSLRLKNRIVMRR
jgi:hypothetical protein